MINKKLFNKFIYIKNNAIKKQHCNNIIKILEDQNLDVANNPRVSNFYKGIFEIPPQKQEWFPDFCIHMENYKKLYPFVGKGNVGYWTVTPKCNYQKYEPKQSYNMEHCEHGPKDSQRIIAWMFYCNDIKKGGETKFPQQNFTAKPKTGTLLIWPAGWTHSHIGLPALNEKKYIVTGWCSYIENQ